MIAIGIMEGIGRTLDPSLNILKAAIPHVMKFELFFKVCSSSLTSVFRAYLASKTSGSD